MQDFYESEVTEYEAAESYAGPFKEICYLGAGFDTTPARTLEGNIDHVDHDSEAVEFMQRQGFLATLGEAEEYNPEKSYHLVIISHLPLTDPLLEPNLTEDGAVICRTDGRAEKIMERGKLDLQAVYEETTGAMVETEEKPFEADLYLFR
jgi:hypothetical protein